MKTYFTFEEVLDAFANESISLLAFAQILADNFGKKKARKILRKNLELKLDEEKMPKEQKQEYLMLISLLV